jgi:hypothetical protein
MQHNRRLTSLRRAPKGQVTRTGRNPPPYSLIQNPSLPRRPIPRLYCPLAQARIVSRHWGPPRACCSRGLRLAVVSAVRQADRKRVTAFHRVRLSIFKSSDLHRLTLTVPEHLAYDTVIPFRFCAPPPPGLLQYTSHSRSVSMIVLTVTVKSSSVCSHHEDDSPCTFWGCR